MRATGGQAMLVGGRVLLASLFVLGAAGKIVAPDFYFTLMRESGIPPVMPLLVAIILLEGIGGLMIAFGTRGSELAALALTLHVLLISVLVHRFWEADGDQQAYMIGLFTKNLAIAGGLLFYAGSRFSSTRRDGIF